MVHLAHIRTARHVLSPGILTHWSREMASKRIKRSDAIYSIGETFKNPYLGNSIMEVRNNKGKRAGWLWSTSEGRIIVSPQLGLYIWYNEGGEEWTLKSGAHWLVAKRKEI
jgi:hypothetical protein